MQDARPTGLQRRGVVAEARGLARRPRCRPAPRRHRRERPRRSRSRSTRHRRTPPRDPAGDRSIQRLRARLLTDDRLEGAHDLRIRVWPNGRAEQVVARLDGRDPVSKRLADRVFERSRAGGHGAHVGAQQAHAIDVQRLTLHVLFAHVHDAFEAEHGAHGGGGHAVLAGARLGDDAPLAHALGQQALADRVVDLVRARVRQVLALEPHRARADALGEARGLVERRRSPDVGAQQSLQLGLEGIVREHAEKAVFELRQRGHDRFRHVLAAVVAEPPADARLDGLVKVPVMAAHGLQESADQARVFAPARVIRRHCSRRPRVAPGSPALWRRCRVEVRQPRCSAARSAAARPNRTAYRCRRAGASECVSSRYRCAPSVSVATTSDAADSPPARMWMALSVGRGMARTSVC